MPGPALISAGVSVIGGLIGGGAARRRARACLLYTSPSPRD